MFWVTGLGLDRLEERALAREEKRREIESEEKKREMESEERKGEMEFELKQLELQSMSNAKSDATGTPNSNMSNPRLPALNIATDQVDLYLERFERHCSSMGWPKQDWPSCLVNLLSGEALTIFLSMDSEESKNYDIVRETLLLRFNCTESGIRAISFRQTSL
ncbi:hypothetical protein ElyMa_006124200 [Elysia marginata]|uniref:Uncharacterized protein n=1 Tax=Elysia marginata TaxID=1093978 RepID=A0AAV4GVK0_9GAST|nr:hypothetical protein ElyMa_006124200 [Elysia marginata]